MNKRLILLLVLLSFQNVFSDSTPPPPPTPPPGVSIDNGIVIMILIGVLFGCYAVRNIRFKKSFQ